MRTITLKDVMLLIQKTLNSTDTRLKGHVEQVAFILLKMLTFSGSFSDQKILTLCSLAFFHDIGAYKAEERQFLKEFEFSNAHGHAIYGYLFMKNFSPMKQHANVVLYHHYYWCDREKQVTEGRIPNESFLIMLADKIALFYSLYRDAEKTKEMLLSRSGTAFCPEYVALFLKADEKYKILDSIKDGSYYQEIYDFFTSFDITHPQALEYAKMLSFAIDFRSESTVIHTITVSTISRLLASKLGLPEKQIDTISVASMLHDIGKIVIPKSILEKPGKLTPEEFELMKKHVYKGGEILDGIGLDDIKNIALYHHEKLDGSGYPFGLKGDQLSLNVRICILSDLISALLQERSYKRAFSKEEITAILSEMALKNKIDPVLTNTFIRDYDSFLAQIKEGCESRILVYKDILVQYKELRSRVDAVVTNR